MILTTNLSFCVSGFCSTMRRGEILVRPNARRTRLALPSNDVVSISGGRIGIMMSNIRMGCGGKMLSCRPAIAARRRRRDARRGPIGSGRLIVPHKNRGAMVLTSKAAIRLGTNSGLACPMHFTNGQEIITLRNRTCFSIMGSRAQPFVIRARLKRMAILNATFGVGTCASTSICAALMRKGMRFSSSDVKAVVLSPKRRTIISTGNSRGHVMSLSRCIN